VAKKADKALKKLRKAVTRLEEQSERLIERLEKQSEDQAEALREIRDLLEERLTTRDAAPAEPAQEDHSSDGETETGPEVTEAAQRRAKELGVDLTGVKGTGSGGRILVKDVEAAADGGR
jgi:pyruvate/2-oxoglutarate dehydrogenase complex dihydrolipoamide acyltransferase (E2) component